MILVAVMCRCTERWVLWRCTFERTRCPVAVLCAAKRSRVRGCFKVTYAPTPENGRSSVHTVNAPLPTDPTFARTCRPTPGWRDIAVRRATNRSLVCHCWPNITRPRLAAATSPVASTVIKTGHWCTNGFFQFPEITQSNTSMPSVSVLTFLCCI